jgi:hypothetical protein
VKFLRYTREEHLFLLKLIYEEDHSDIQVLAYIAFKEFNEARSLKSYMIRISDIRHYILNGASSKFKKVLRNDVKEFITTNSKKDKKFNEIFMYKIESLINFIDIGPYPEL